MEDVNQKADFLQNSLMRLFYDVFPLKSMKISNDDEPWISENVKCLDRQRKREFYKNHKSEKWKVLNQKFLEAVKKSKNSYKVRIVDDLKKSNPGKWYSKLKRMSGLN